MIIDFHTHVFPDDLAARAMKTLAEGCGNIYPMMGDGTVSGLLKNMDEWNIDISVVHPVITKQSQMKKVNEWAAATSSDRLIFFGGIYPHTDDYRRDIDFVVDLGLKGLKFHAEYQNFLVDDEQMLEIYAYAVSKGLIILHHAGFDPAFEPPFKSSPKRFANVSQAIRGGVTVAAHLGGHEQWAEVEEDLAGCDIYFDTSIGFEYFQHDQFLKIVKKHGADKILFGSDSPWSKAKTEIEFLKALPFPPEDKDAILCGNAKRILAL